MAGVKRPQVCGCFTDTDVTDGCAQFACYRKQHAAAGGAIQLGDGNAGYIDRLVEMPGLVQRIGAGARVHHQHDLVRCGLIDTSDDTANLF